MGKNLLWMVLGVAALLLIGSFVLSALGVLFKFVLWGLFIFVIVSGATSLVWRVRERLMGPRADRRG